jgi:hypothetical protein
MSVTSLTHHRAFRDASRAVPDDTPAARIRVLEERYRIGSDPTVQAIPPEYRQAILSRLHELIARSSVMGPAR